MALFCMLKSVSRAGKLQTTGFLKFVQLRPNNRFHGRCSHGDIKKPKHKVQGMPNGEAPGILSIATTILLSLHNFHFCLRVSLRKTFLNLNISLGCYNATSSLMPLIALRTLKFFVECSLQEAQKYLVKSSPSRPSKQRFQIGRSL